MAEYKFFAQAAWVGIARVEDPDNFGVAAAELAFRRWLDDLDFKDFARDLPVGALDEPGMEDVIEAADAPLKRTTDTIIVTDAAGNYDIRF